MVARSRWGTCANYAPCRRGTCANYAPRRRGLREAAVPVAAARPLSHGLPLQLTIAPTFCGHCLLSWSSGLMVVAQHWQVARRSQGAAQMRLCRRVSCPNGIAEAGQCQCCELVCHNHWQLVNGSNGPESLQLAHHTRRRRGQQQRGARPLRKGPSDFNWRCHQLRTGRRTPVQFHHRVPSQRKKHSAHCTLPTDRSPGPGTFGPERYTVLSAASGMSAAPAPPILRQGLPPHK
jgi:hypothetical protein